MTTLTTELVQKRQEFTKKLADKQLTRFEAVELKNILQIEKEIALKSNDLLLLFAIGVLIALVLKILED